MDLRAYGVTIPGEHIFLRTLMQGDASQVYADWLNDPDVNQYLETRAATIPELQRYIQEKLDSATALFFGIFWQADGRHIGNVKLEPIDIDAGRATLGILIGDKTAWGRGVGTAATRFITDFAFRTLGLSEVNLGVISENMAAIRVYEKCGFVAERVDKDALDHDGKKFDQVWMKKIRPYDRRD